MFTGHFAAYFCVLRAAMLECSTTEMIATKNAWKSLRGGMWSSARSGSVLEVERYRNINSVETYKSNGIDNDADVTARNESYGQDQDHYCENGVCHLSHRPSVKLDDAESNRLSSTPSPECSAEFRSEEFNELLKMGWEPDRISVALEAHCNDVVAAAESLALEEERDLEVYKTQLLKLYEQGWDEDTSLSVLRKTCGDISESKKILEEEDRLAVQQFETSVHDMVNNGWNPEVARSALLMQWRKDIERQGNSARLLKQLKDAGYEFSEEKKKKEDVKRTATKAETVSKDSVIFEVDGSNFQRVVLESPVPVLLDVYADWCGPCKQLTPALEEMTIKGGGIFRLAKMNSDKNRTLTQLLRVEALPSVFAIKNGAVVNKFVGGLEVPEMQAFMTDLILVSTADSGKAKSKQAFGAPERRSISFKLQHEAGLSAIGMSRKMKISEKIDSILAEVDSSEAGALLRATKFIGKLCENSISAFSDGCIERFNRINREAESFKAAIGDCEAALNILNVAGFKETEDGKFLSLRHRNSAILILVQDKCEQFLRKNKYSLETDEFISNDSPPSLEQTGKVTDAVVESDAYGSTIKSQLREHSEALAKEENENESTEKTSASFEIVVEGVPDRAGPILVAGLTSMDTLQSIFSKVKDDRVIGFTSIKTRNVFTRVKDGSLSLEDAKLRNHEHLRALLRPSTAATSSEPLPKHRIPKMKPANSSPKKSGTLYGSDGIISSKPGKFTENFGGGTTVTLSGDEAEQENSVDPIKNHISDEFKSSPERTRKSYKLNKKKDSIASTNQNNCP